MEDQAIGTLRLAVAPWVSHKGIVYVDAVVPVEIPELGPGKGGAQVRDDLVGHSEPVRYFFDELSCLSRRCG